MADFFVRLLSLERRGERDKRTIKWLTQRVLELEQQLIQLRGNV